MISPNLPDFCWVTHRADNTAVLVKRGERGYYPTDYDPPLPGEMVSELNERLGVSKAQEMAMEAGSLFGWHIPAADPETWKAKGV
jgi:hypothetical protein